MRIPCTFFGSLTRENLLHLRSLESFVFVKSQDSSESRFTSGLERLAPKGRKTTHGRSSKKPTVGRLDDLQWIAKATYRRFPKGGANEPAEKALLISIR